MHRTLRIKNRHLQKQSLYTKWTHTHSYVNFFLFEKFHISLSSFWENNYETALQNAMFMESSEKNNWKEILVPYLP